MASRLQPDDAKAGQSTWADIEDEEDDWEAPEAITWTDGTKTTIPHVDETEVIPEQLVPKENKVVEKPQSPAPSAASPSVRPVFASGKGLVLKSASSEKPTLVAKPPAPPTPVKSPWAQLPPVTKSSPMEAANEPPHGRFQPPGQGYFSRGGPPPAAAREIAADDFSRSPRRDNQQLFNSQSGRYEPVSDRRGLARTDFNQRQPAVLQRPIHSESQGPAEPSAAFQTHHSSAGYGGGGYGRRRNSSNVSGGSGSFQRMGRPHDQTTATPELLSARRSSFVSAGEHPISPHNFSPSGPQGDPRQPSTSPYQPRASPAMSSAAPQISEPRLGDGGVETPATQASAPAPQAAVENTVEFQKRLMQERRAEAIKRRQEEEASEEAERKERLAKKLAALGPPPERKSVKKEVGGSGAQEAPAAPVNKSMEAPEALQMQASNDAHSPETLIDDKSGPLPNGVPQGTQPQAKLPTAPAHPANLESKHGHLGTWQSRANQNKPQSERLPPNSWGSGPANLSANLGVRNVWGAPNEKDRTLGNGTFSTAAGFDARPSQTGPINSGRPRPIAPPPKSAPAGPSSQLGPIGPPSRNLSQAEKVQKQNRWTNAVLANDAEITRENQAKHAALESDMKARGLTYADLDRQYNSIKDQYTEVDEEGQALKRTEDTTYGNDVSWSATSGGRQDDKRLSTARSISQNGTTTLGTAQKSRFFPASHYQQPEPLAPDTGRPPEEGGSHPAFDGDASHPHVSLPKWSKPVVKLPPASAASTTSQRHSQPVPVRGQGPLVRDHGPGRGQDTRSAFDASNSGNNQGVSMVDRIRNLFVDKPASVNSSSRSALMQATPTTPATVSLPGIYAPSTIVDSRSYVTKTMDEECFEEQVMGSLPKVDLPNDAPEAAYAPARFPPRQDRRLLAVVPATADAYSFYDRTDRDRIFIYLPNHPAQNRKSVPMTPTGAPRSPNPRRGPRSSSARYPSHRGGGRSRESSTQYSPEQASSPGTASGRGGRSFRGSKRSDNWGRAPAPAIQTQ